MTYQSRTIAQVVPEINTEVLLPAIQREFVWDPEQITRLFDSITRGYPIGSFLFWNVPREIASEQVMYEFVKDYVDEAVFPSQLDGVHHNPRVRDRGCVSDRPTLVLDGQQRLTSLYVGLCGSLFERRHNTRRKKVGSWRQKRLYLNLFNDPSIENDDVDERYEFSFRQMDVGGVRGESYWYPVGKILDVDKTFEEVNRVMEVVDDNSLRGAVSENLGALYNAVHKENVVTYFEENTVNEDKILDIFIRANEGGTELEKSDMFLSMITAGWNDGGDDGILARDQIRELTDELNDHSVHSSTDFTPRFILRSLMGCSGVPPRVNYTKINNQKNLNRMKDVWLTGDVQDAIWQTLDLIDSFGLSTRGLSPGYMIPIVYYLYHNDTVLDSNTARGRENRDRILRWIGVSRLKSILGGSVPQRINKALEVVRQSSELFPEAELKDSMTEYGGRTYQITDNLFDNIQKGSGRCNVALSLTYRDRRINSAYSYDVDHIFPRSKLSAEYLQENTDIGLEKCRMIHENRDNIGNLQLLRERVNTQKTDKLPQNWLQDKNEQYYIDHCIPYAEEKLSVENYLDFIEARREMLLDCLRDDLSR